jgi:hypothetical protein
MDLATQDEAARQMIRPLGPPDVQLVPTAQAGLGSRAWWSDSAEEPRLLRRRLQHVRRHRFPLLAGPSPHALPSSRLVT